MSLADKLHYQGLVRGATSRKNYNEYEHLAKASYGHGLSGKSVHGYDIIPELSTDDRVAYKNKNSNHVVIAFRGTDPTGFEYLGPNPWASGMPHLPGSGKEVIQTALKSGWYSRAFRDVTTDIALGLEMEGYNSRFQKAEKVTQRGIQKYGKENVTVVGHSLGGSQALHVSKKYGVDAVAFNPYVGPQHLATSYPHASIVHNVTDPVSIASPFVKARDVQIRYNTAKAPTIGQHSLHPKPISKPKSSSSYYVRPVSASRSGPRAIQ
jgi:pimeloyl-ACP methyl ester carboxylesterase